MVVQRLIFFFVLLLSLAFPVAAENGRADYGLSFRSHSYAQEERTGLDLCPDGVMHFHDRMILEFDIKFAREDQNFGYVFRVFSGNASIDMLSNISADHISFVVSDGHRSVGNISFDGDIHQEEGRWYHIKVASDSRGGMECSIDGISRSLPVDIFGWRNVRICFGWNDDPIFFTTDVPPVTIRDVKVWDGDRLMYHWELARHNKDDVFDLVSGRRAAAREGIWVMDAHYIWHNELSMHMSSLPMVAYDRETSRIFVATEDSMYVCGLDGGGHILSGVRASGTPVLQAVNQMVYDPSADRLLSYSMHGAGMAVYDFRSSSWSGSFSETWPPLTGHGTYFDSDSSILYLFGGYGNHRYSADFTEIDTRTGKRTVTDLSAMVWPRYFSSFCADNRGDFIVMGGYGSKSGHQEEAPAMLHDIFRIDRQTKKCTEVGRFSTSLEPVLFSSSMVYDGNSDRLYSLAFHSVKFNTSISLISADMGTDSLRHYASPIGFAFHDMDSYAELLFSRDSSTLYAIVANAGHGGSHRIDVWSLAYPPVSIEDITQPLPDADRTLVYIALAAIVLLFGTAAASVSYLMYRRRIRSAVQDDGLPSAVSGSGPDALSSVSELSGGIPAGKAGDLSGMPVERQFGISLLGGFKIIGLAGNDVTEKFSPKLRSLFIYLILRACGHGKSVTTEELNDAFWFGMDRTSASNNRNVNFKRLRQIFQDIGKITLTVDKDIVMLRLGSDVTCDYTEMMSALENSRDTGTVNPDILVKLVDIARRGTLLPGYEYEWLDPYKSGYSELLIGVMMKAAENPVISADSAKMAMIADAILREDSLDEFAIRLKCRLLYSSGHKGLAQAAYDKWSSDYRRLMDSDPGLSFSDILGQDTD